MKRRAWAGLGIFIVGTALAQSPESAPPVSSSPPAISDATLRSLARLREEREALLKERRELMQQMGSTDLTADERARLRAQIQELIAKVATRPPAAATHAATTQGKSLLPIRTDHKPADPISLARLQFQAQDYEGALRSLKMADLESTERQDRAFARYLAACCLRSQGKKSEAMAMYREVADAKEDEFFCECALWQLSAMKWQQDALAQLEDSVKRRESKAAPTS